MSYSRWDDKNNWYAFWCSGSPEGKESEMLALWHCKGEKEQLFDWTYAELDGVDEKWFREHYEDLSDSDVSKAIDIVITFRWEVEAKVYYPTKETLRANPSPENIDVILDLFTHVSDESRSDWSQSSGDLLDILFSFNYECNSLVFGNKIFNDSFIFVY